LCRHLCCIEGPLAEPLSEPRSDIDAVVGQRRRLGTADDLGNRRAGKRGSQRVQASLPHDAEFSLYVFDDRLRAGPCSWVSRSQSQIRSAATRGPSSRSRAAVSQRLTERRKLALLSFPI